MVWNRHGNPSKKHTKCKDKTEMVDKNRQAVVGVQ